MGEFAQYNGDRIKIGTCEEMYYLRFDQRSRVRAVEGSVDPVGDEFTIRFRFPFADEDDVEPGQFEDFNRGLAVPGYMVPEKWLEGMEPIAGEDVQIVQQKVVAVADGESRQLWTIVRVPIVGAGLDGKAFRLPLDEAARVAEALAAQATALLAEGDTEGTILRIETAKRMLAGYNVDAIIVVDELTAKS